MGKKSDINATVIDCVRKCLEVEIENVKLKEKYLYDGQVQFGTAVINVEEIDFVIYCTADNKVFIVKVKRNDIFIKMMLIELKKLQYEKIFHYTCLKNKK